MKTLLATIFTLTMLLKIPSYSNLAQRTFLLQEPVKCTSTDPNAPCYSRIEKSVVSTNGNSVTGGNITQTQRCIFVQYNYAGSAMAKLWGDLNVTWNWNSTLQKYMSYTINWGSRGTWVANPLYAWGGLSGPTPSSGTYNYGFYIPTQGTLYYMGISQGIKTVRQYNRMDQQGVTSPVFTCS